MTNYRNERGEWPALRRMDRWPRLESEGLSGRRESESAGGGGVAAPTSPELFRHGLLLYGSDDEYVAAVVPFLLEGIACSDAVLAAPSKLQGGLLRDALGEDARHVEFLDSAEWYRTLRGAANGYRSLVKERFDSGAP